MIKPHSTTKLSPRGNSQAVTIPKDVLNALGMESGDELEIYIDEAESTIMLKRRKSDQETIDDAFHWALQRYDFAFKSLPAVED